MRKQIILHIGYPKTGTTTLQNHFFDKSELINNIGKPFSKKSSDNVLHICKHLSNVQSDYFEKNINKEKDILFDILEKNEAPIVVLSNEHLVGHWNEKLDDHLLFQRLQKLFCPKEIEGYKIKIMISLRRQADLLLSSYAEKRFSLLEGCNLKKFVEEGISAPHEAFIFQNIFFYDKIRTLEEYFSKERIYLFLFEELNQSFHTYSAKLASMLEIDQEYIESFLKRKHENKKTVTRSGYNTQLGLPTYIIRLLRRHTGRRLYVRNSTLRLVLKRASQLLTLNASVSKETNIQMSETNRQRVQQIYKDTNQKLMQRYHLDMDKYSYLDP